MIMVKHFCLITFNKGFFLCKGQSFHAIIDDVASTSLVKRISSQRESNFFSIKEIVALLSVNTKTLLDKT